MESKFTPKTRAKRLPSDEKFLQLGAICFGNLCLSTYELMPLSTSDGKYTLSDISRRLMAINIDKKYNWIIKWKNSGFKRDPYSLEEYLWKYLNGNHQIFRISIGLLEWHDIYPVKVQKCTYTIFRSENINFKISMCFKYTYMCDAFLCLDSGTQIKFNKGKYNWFFGEIWVQYTLESMLLINEPCVKYAMMHKRSLFCVG